MLQESTYETMPRAAIDAELAALQIDPAPAVEEIRRMVARSLARQLLVQNLALIERITAFIGRRNHLDDDATAELIAEVRLRLIENDYAVLRKFEGRSSLPTYLTTVIHRMFNHLRIEAWGKWRPSAEARRLGDKAITLERLLTRDGHSMAEARQLLLGRPGTPYTAAELDAIHLRLPIRRPRPVLVTDDMPVDLASSVSADERMLARDRAVAARLAAGAIDLAIEHLDAEDRCILQMRFWEACKVPEIARRLHLDQKKLYKRIDRLLLVLRHAVEAAGVGADAIDEILTRGDQEVVFRI